MFSSERKKQSRPPNQSSRPQQFCVRACVSVGDWLHSFKAGISFHRTWGWWGNINLEENQCLLLLRHLKSENGGRGSLKLAPCPVGTSSFAAVWAESHNKEPWKKRRNGKRNRCTGHFHLPHPKQRRKHCSPPVSHIFLSRYLIRHDFFGFRPPKGTTSDKKELHSCIRAPSIQAFLAVRSDRRFSAGNHSVSQSISYGRHFSFCLRETLKRKRRYHFY